MSIRSDGLLSRVIGGVVSDLNAISRVCGDHLTGGILPCISRKIISYLIPLWVIWPMLSSALVYSLLSVCIIG